MKTVGNLMFVYVCVCVYVTPLNISFCRTWSECVATVCTSCRIWCRYDIAPKCTWNRRIFKWFGDLWHVCWRLFLFIFKKGPKSITNFGGNSNKLSSITYIQFYDSYTEIAIFGRNWSPWCTALCTSELFMSDYFCLFNAFTF